MEVLKSFDDLLDLPYFVGAEKAQTPEAAIMGAEKGCDWIKQCLDYYQDRPFVNPDGSLNIQTVPDIMIKQIEQIIFGQPAFIAVPFYCCWNWNRQFSD